MSRFGSAIVIFWLFRLVLCAGIGATVGTVKILAVPGDTVVNRSLKLVNPDGYAKKFIISNITAEQKPGYHSIDDVRWVRILPETISVAGRGRSEPIEIKVSIPNKPEYRNRRFSCRIEISQYASGALSTGLVIPLYIDTKPTRNVPDKCKNCGIIVYPNTLSIKEGIDSLTIVNWDSDTAKLTVSWKGRGKGRWRDALTLMENIMGALVPLPDTITVAPKAKKRIFIKPILFPGHGKIYFTKNDGKFDFININWEK